MKKRNYILIAAAVLCIGGLTLGTFFAPDVDFSANENRYLAQRPDFSISNVLSGRFEKQSEEYLNDQIIGREKWVSIRSITEKALGITDMNGVYICSDGRLVERHTEADFPWGQYHRNLDETETLGEICREAGIEFHVMLVPTAAEIYSDVLPDNALRFDEDRAFAMAAETLGESFVDIRGDLADAASGGDVFFRTDHHWTSRGAWTGYRSFAEAAGTGGTTGTSYEDLDKKVLTEDFKGTLYSKVLLNYLETDTIEIAASALEAEYQLLVEGREAESIFFMDKLEEKDKYAVFFGGNYAQVDIDLGSSGEKLLIVKDSFANSFVPFLTGDFSEITMVDTRFYRYSVAELAGDYDRVLVLYSVNNFAGERLILTESLLK